MVHVIRQVFEQVIAEAMGWSTCSVLILVHIYHVFVIIAIRVLVVLY